MYIVDEYRGNMYGGRRVEDKWLQRMCRDRVSKYNQTVYPLVNDEVMFHRKRLLADGTMKGSLSGMRADMVSQAAYQFVHRDWRLETPTE